MVLEGGLRMCESELSDDDTGRRGLVLRAGDGSPAAVRTRTPPC